MTTKTETYFPPEIWKNHIYPEMGLYDLIRNHPSTAKNVITEGKKIINNIVEKFTLPTILKEPSSKASPKELDFIEKVIGKENAEDFKAVYDDHYADITVDNMEKLDVHVKKWFIYHAINGQDESVLEIINGMDEEDKPIFKKFLLEMRRETRKKVYEMFSLNELRKLEKAITK